MSHPLDCNIHKVHSCNHLNRTEDIVKGIYVSLPRAIETMDPKKSEFPQERLVRRRKRLEVWCQPEENLVYWKDFTPF